MIRALIMDTVANAVVIDEVVITSILAMRARAMGVLCMRGGGGVGGRCMWMFGWEVEVVY